MWAVITMCQDESHGIGLGEGLHGHVQFHRDAVGGMNMQTTLQKTEMHMRLT